MGLLRGVARTAVVAGTATAVSGRVQRRQQARWASQEDQAQQEAYAQQAYAQPAYDAPAPAAADPLEQLQKLGELKAQGVLTDAEFEVQKAKLLAG
ncbi:SHOCT domain-containing protein [Mycetocola sp. 2940]|uniref:SHOCT domain-containing protein n=1 Tax=Mycetocola sp. 2940 TaxID=3156452 RepID=UPI003391F367